MELRQNVRGNSRLAKAEIRGGRGKEVAQERPRSQVMVEGGSASANYRGKVVVAVDLETQWSKLSLLLL
jgi:MinD-like ATPase involved in chromosome partitioning or flagellar assembly